MLRIFMPLFSILGGQYLPDCYEKNTDKTENDLILYRSSGVSIVRIIHAAINPFAASSSESKILTYIGATLTVG